MDALKMNHDLSTAQSHAYVSPYLYHSNLFKLSFWVWPYFAMLVIGLMMPSDGNHGIMTPKSLSFLSCFVLMMYYSVLRYRITKYQLYLICFALMSLSFLLIWMFIGHWQKDEWLESAFDQFKIFAITIATVMMTLNLVSEGLTTREKILKIIIYANFIYSIIKVLVVVLHFTGILNMFKVLDLLGIRYMSMAMLQGNLSRLQTSVDIITPFLLLFVLQGRQLNLGFSRRFIYCYVLVSLPAIFLSFSRFLYGVATVSMILYWCTLNFTGLLRVIFLTVILGCCGIAWVGIEKVEILIYERFFSYDNKMSDQVRVDQINALMNELEITPILGKGLGGYVEGLVRDGAIQYSYEVQWVAFLMQFGILGFTVLLIPVLLIGYKLFLPPFSRVKLGFLGLFIVWILSGFTNPFLISLTSGIVYSIFILASDILNQQLNENEELMV